MEFTIEKGDGSTFSPEAGGESRKTATIQVCSMLKLTRCTGMKIYFGYIIRHQVLHGTCLN